MQYPLSYLFEKQEYLDNHIGYNESDKSEKLFLAVLTELGETANRYRGFKFWSTNQKPDLIEVTNCSNCGGNGYVVSRDYQCSPCEGQGKFTTYPLIEEYVDGLHFILNIGLHLYKTMSVFELPLIIHQVNIRKSHSIERQFLNIYSSIVEIESKVMAQSKFVTLEYQELIELYIGLGEMFGFTWEQILEAYGKKNKVNHQRQVNGY